MKKPLVILLSLIIISGILLLVNPLFTKPDIGKKIDDLRKKTAPELDSFNKNLNAENRFFDSIQYLISSGQLVGADSIINQLLEKDSRNDYYWTLKGQIFDARQQYDSALFEYNFAIVLMPSPNALDKRAKTFIKMKKYNEAIQDYKNAYEQNNDFSYKLAQTFEIAKQKDSALKYYNIYFEKYPDSVLQKKIKLLQK